MLEMRCSKKMSISVLVGVGIGTLIESLPAGLSSFLRKQVQFINTVQGNRPTQLTKKEANDEHSGVNDRAVRSC
jgi:hypothetical protein